MPLSGCGVHEDKGALEKQLVSTPPTGEARPVSRWPSRNSQISHGWFFLQAQSLESQPQKPSDSGMRPGLCSFVSVSGRSGVVSGMPSEEPHPP